MTESPLADAIALRAAQRIAAGFSDPVSATQYDEQAWMETPGDRTFEEWMDWMRSGTLWCLQARRP